MDQNEYALYAEVEEKHWWFRVRRSLLSIFVKKIPDIKEKSILEVGSGTGGNLKFLFNKFKKRSGLEYNELGVQFSREKLHDNAKIIHGDGNNLKDLKETYDCIAFLDVLYHEGIKDVQSVLSQAYDSLNKKGYILITDGAYSFLEGGESRTVHSARRFTQSGLEKMLVNSGFEIVKASYWGTILFFILFLKRVILERVFKNSKRKSEVVSLSIVDNLFYFLVRWEKPFLKFTSFPFGASVAILARKTNS